MKTKVIFAILIVLMSVQFSRASTYYVSQSGSDSNSGLSWGNAWASPNRTNGNISPGDTVRFGAGEYFDVLIYPPTGGTPNSITVYACSTFGTISDLDGSDTWHDAILNGGRDISDVTWVPHSGNIWKCEYVWSGDAWNRDGFNYKCYTMTVNDTLFGEITNYQNQNESLSSLSSAGMFYSDIAASPDSFYIWCFGNANPNNQTIVAAVHPVIWLTSGAMDHIQFYGLDIRMGKQAVIMFDQGADSIFIEHCNLSRAGGQQGSNVSIIYSDAGEGDWAEYNVIRSCSLSCASGAHSGALFNDPFAGHQGDGSINYNQRFNLWDSCAFYQGDGEAASFNLGVFYKNDMAAGDDTCWANVIRYCSFDSMINVGVYFGRYTRACSTYGCTFTNSARTAVQLGFRETNNYGDHFIGNNSFYQCTRFVYCDEAPGPGFEYEVKYNIGFDIQDQGSGDGSYNGVCQWIDMHTQIDADYNYWPDPNQNFNSRVGGSVNFVQYQSYGHDVHGDTIIGNFEFNNPEYGDFSRPYSSQEMDVTYGGRRWTRFGAWQPPSGPDNDPPIITNISAEYVTENSATIIWITNELATSQVNYGQTSGYGQSSDYDGSLVAYHSIELTGLQFSTLYHFRVRSTDASDNESVSGDYTFTTSAPDFTPPVISNVGPINTTDNSSTIAWITDEPATSQVNYGQTSGYGQSTAIDQTLLTNHYIFIGNLEPDVLYHYQVISSDGSGNQSISADYTFRTDTTNTLENLALGGTVQVSGTYGGYSPDRINDDVISPRGGTGTTWASDESSSPHWIEFDFGENKLIHNITIYWAYNSFQSRFMCSRQYHIQYWNDDQNNFENIITVNNSSSDSVTVTDIEPVNTLRIRYYQPSNMGAETYPGIIWLTEFQIFGLNIDDHIPPNPIMDLEALPGDNDGDIILDWTAPGDDGDVGLADHYDIRYAQTPITESNWEAAVESPFPPTPASPGETQNFIISGLAEGEVYYIAIKTYDDVGWDSELSNVTESFSCGICVPVPLETEVDSVNTSATMFAQTVESYYSLYYIFELDSLAYYPNPEFNIDFSADTMATVTFGDLSQEYSYFWRVCAVTSNGSDTSDWSQSTQFNLLTGVANTLTNNECVYPQQDDIVPSGRPFLSVNNLPGINAYYFQLDDNSGFTHPVESGPIMRSSGMTTAWQVPELLIGGHTYYWRVSSNGIFWTFPISFFAVLEIHPFPNPFRASAGHAMVTFTNLVEGCNIIITTISGNIVLHEDGIGPNDWVWDVKNDRGQDLAPGIYLYNIDFPSGSSHGKVVVIR